MPVLGESPGERAGDRSGTALAGRPWPVRGGLSRPGGEAPMGAPGGRTAGVEARAAGFGGPAALPGRRPAQGASLGGLFTACANADCGSGWLHLWRGRSAPVFEGGWSCSGACTAAMVARAVRREMDGRGTEVTGHRHRVPLGLVMLEQGWITPDQLRQALDAQKAAGEGRLGVWLTRQLGVPEQLVTRALSLQWSCPVLSLDYHDAEGLAALIPRLFVDAFGALPLRVAAGRILYLGFEDRLDPALALGVERMTGLHVETGLVRGSLFRPAHQRMLNASFPRAELLEVRSEPVLARVLAKTIERVKPIESRLVRVHDCLWLRMWLRPQTGPAPEPRAVEDVVCSLDAN